MGRVSVTNGAWISVSAAERKSCPEGRQKGPRRDSCACLPLANAEAAHRGPLLGGNASEASTAGQSGPTLEQTGPVPVQGVTHRLWITLWTEVWRTGPVLWITPAVPRGPPQWGGGEPTVRRTTTDAYAGWPCRGTAPDRVPARAQPCRDLQGQGLPRGGSDDPAAGRRGGRAGAPGHPARAARHRRLDRRGHRGRRQGRVPDRLATLERERAARCPGR